MSPDFQRLMQDAARHTRGGDLQAAADAIRTALGGSPPVDANPVHPPRGDIVIDVEAREVPGAGETIEFPPRHDGPPCSEAPGDPARPGAEGRFVAARAHGLDYKLFIPPQARNQPLPLVVMLHGCAQDPDDFAA